jgi:bla regulator protein blaR1
MISDMTNHLWQSTVFAILAGLLALAFRRNHAQVRYGLWFSASVKFLIPFSLLLTLGGYLGRSHAAKPRVMPAITYTLVQVVEPMSEGASAAVPSLRSHGDSIPLAAAGLWACGFAGIALMRLRGWRRIRAAVRSSAPMDLPFPVAVRSSPTLLEPGVVGFFRPILLLPAGIVQRLTPSQLQAVLAHEQCHVKRRDNMTGAIHMIVEAVFWFYPLIWWISARLVQERERACDEDVLESGGDRKVYADSILKTCQYFVESPLACVSGITSAGLKERIVRIMTQNLANDLSLGGKLLLAAIGTAALAGPLVFGTLNVTRVRAQVAETAARPGSSFEVASIKPNRSADTGFSAMFLQGRFTATGATIKQLITLAYSVKESQVSGGPSWISSEKYDVEGKEPDALAEELLKLPFEQRARQMGAMLQSLLEGRLKLKVSRDTKELPVYALVVAKNGPRLTPSAIPPSGPSGANPPGGPGVRVESGQIPDLTMPIDGLVEVLSRQPELGGREVVDETGLEGIYTISLRWSPDERPSGMPVGPGGAGPGATAAPRPDTSGPSLFTALQEQLGLKLEPAKRPVRILVIDHIERPSEN